MSGTLIGILGFALGSLVFLLIDRTRRSRTAGAQAAANETAARMVEEARKEADALRKEAELRAKDVVLQAKNEAERDAREQRRELAAVEKRVAQKEEAADRKVESLASRETDLAGREESLRERDRSIEAKRAEITGLVDAVRRKLEETAGMTRDEAKRSLVEQMTEEARGDAAKQIRQIESEAREEADRRAKKIVSIAIERLSGEFVADRTVSVVALPSDDMKGRIIGREGRNIRAIEAATGVDLIIDDTPEAVVISCHNPIRRELARLALDRLISDGRIHPGRIEEVVRKAEQELEESIREAGQRAVIELGLHGVHQELDPAGRHAQVSLLVRPERARTLDRDRVHRGRAGRRARAEREAGASRGAAARHRQGADARGGGIARHRRRRDRAQVRRVGEDRQRDRGPPRGGQGGNHPGPSGGCGRCAVRRPSRRTPRGAGELRQAPGGPRAHQQLVQGGRAVLRRAGRDGRSASSSIPGRYPTTRRRCWHATWPDASSRR